MRRRRLRRSRGRAVTRRVFSRGRRGAPRRIGYRM